MTDSPMPPQGGPDGYAPAETAAPAARGVRKGLLIGAGATALVVVAGAAVVATTTLSGGGRQPDELVPKTAFAMVKVDLDPAANQKLAAREFFGKFEGLKDSAGDEDTVFEDVLADLIQGEDLDYDRDVKPWFDKRAAVAAFPGRGGENNVVVVLRSKDDDKAKASLDRAQADAKAEGEDVAYRITKGYAVVGSEDAVTQAVELTANESMKDNKAYQDDVAKLDGDQVAVAWANIGQAFDSVRGAIPFGGMLPGLVTDQVKGRMVAGLHLTGDYVEVQARVFGAPPPTQPQTGDQAVLKDLPASTSAAVSLLGVGKGLTQAQSTGLGLDQMLAPYLEGSGLTVGDDIAPLLGDETVVAAGALPKSWDDLRVGLVSKVTDEAKARAAAAKITPMLQFFGLDARTEVNAERFVLAMPGTYAAELAGGDGGLGDSPKFGKAMGDLNGTTFAAYLDVDAAQAAFPRLAAGPEEALSALGMVAGYDGDEGWFRLRVVAE